MTTFILTVFWVQVFAVVCNAILLIIKDDDVGTRVVSTLISLGFIGWAGYLLWGR